MRCRLLTALGQLSPSTLLDKATGNDVFHDFEGPTGELHLPDVSVRPRDRVLPHIAPATEELEALVDDLDAICNRGELAHRGVNRVEYSLQMEVDAAIDKHTLSSRLSCKLGKFELSILELPDWVPQRCPLSDVLQSPPECRLGRCHRAHRLGEPLLRQLVHCWVNP